jgi:hypothetical protein
METKVISFSSSYATNTFCLSDGSIRMIGDAGKTGTFGFYSKGTNTVSCISNSGVKVRSIVDNKFILPPTKMGKIIQCETVGSATYAIDEDFNLHYWGTLSKFELKNIPADRKVKRMIAFSFSSLVFVLPNGKNVLHRIRKGTVGDELHELANAMTTCGALKNAFVDNGYLSLLEENGKLTIITFHRSAEKAKSSKWLDKIEVDNCEWIISSSNIYYKTTDKGVCEFITNDSRYQKSFLEKLYEEKNPILLNAKMGFNNYSGGSETSLLTEDNSVVSIDYHTNELNLRSYSFNSPVVQLGCTSVLLESGIVMPIRENKYYQTNMILSVFPEWADNEEIVYDMCKICPRNFLSASPRLRKDIEFSKRISLLGANAMEFVDGMVRRNRELRPIQKLYGLLKD